MKRYNISTQKDDNLIQIDLKDNWTIGDDEEALLTVVELNYPKTKSCSIKVTKKDLKQLAYYLNIIIGANGESQQDSD